MKDSFFTLRTFLILSLMLLSAESFAQRRQATPRERQAMIDEGVDGEYDEQTQDGGQGMPCDDPRTIGEANRSAEENACWDSYARGIEDGIRRQSEEFEEAVRRHNESMRRSEERERGRNGNRGFGRDFYDW